MPLGLQDNTVEETTMTGQIAGAVPSKPGFIFWAEGAVLALGCIAATLAIFTISWLIFKHLGWTLRTAPGTPWGFYGTVGRISVGVLLGKAARAAIDWFRYYAKGAAKKEASR
jgi:hypothetical protein